MTTLSAERVEKLSRIVEGMRVAMPAVNSQEVFNDLLSILSDYSTLKAENERLRAENLELGAELTSMLNDEIADGFDRNDIEKLQARAEKAEAELAQQAPLIRAVMRAWIAADHPVANSVTRTLIFANAIHEDDILRAALALREEKK